MQGFLNKFGLLEIDEERNLTGLAGIVLAFIGILVPNFSVLGFYSVGLIGASGWGILVLLLIIAAAGAYVIRMNRMGSCLSILAVLIYLIIVIAVKSSSDGLASLSGGFWLALIGFIVSIISAFLNPIIMGLIKNRK